MNRICSLAIFCIMLLTNMVCLAKEPIGSLGSELNTVMVASENCSQDHSGNLKKSYKSLQEINNVRNFLPVELEKEVGKEVENFGKFFFLSANETYLKESKKLVMTNVMVGGGAENEIYQYLVKKYGKPDASYEIKNEFPRGWFSPGRMIIWEDKENVLVLITEYAHGLRSNVKVMTKEFYASLKKDSKYFRY